MSNAIAVKTIKAKALVDERGRRRKNKARRNAGEPVVRTKAYYLAGFSSDEMKALEAGEKVTKTYNSGRTEMYTLV